MIVKESVVKEWFVRGSFMHRQFSFLFNNPLWSKKVPGGFSVCPYFWLSMFSLFILRPVVFLITKGIMPCVKLGGKPVVALDRCLFNLIFNKWWKTESSHERNPALGLFLGFIAFPIAIFLVLIVGIQVYKWAILLFALSAGQKIPILMGIGYLASIIAIQRYLANRVDDSERCKAEYHVYLLSALVVIGSIILLPASCLAVLAGIKSSIVYASVGTWIFLKWLFSGVWSGLSTSVVWLASILWIVAKFMFQCIIWAPFGYYIPWWVLMAGFGFLVERLSYYVTFTNEKAKYDQGTSSTFDKEAFRRSSNLNNWLYHSAELLFHKDYWNTKLVNALSKKLKDAAKSDEALAILARDNKHKWYESLLKKQHGPLFQRLAEHACPMNFLALRKRKEDDFDERYKFLYDTMNDALAIEKASISSYLPDPLVSEPCTHRRANSTLDVDDWYVLLIGDYISELSSEEVSKLVDQLKSIESELKFQQQLKEERERNRAARQSWFSKKIGEPSRRWCKAVTEKIAIVVNFIGNCIKWCWNTGKAAVRNIWIFMVYMWKLAVAWKKGACPYFAFEEKAAPKENK